jgi:cellulose synthase operon protein C
LRRSPRSARPTRSRRLVALRDEPGARAAYKKADEVLEEWAGAVPLGEGREAFLRAHGRAARSHLSALVAWAEEAARAADPRAIALRREGAQVARRMATRAVVALADVAAVERLPASAGAAWSQAVGRYRARRAVLEEKAAWGERGGHGRAEAVAEARDALRKELDQALSLLGGRPRGALEAPLPEAGEVHVAFAELGATWVAFTSTAEATDLHLLGPVSPDGGVGALAARLLDPLRAALRRSSRVRIVSDGPGSGLDLHRLPLDGSPLFASRTVVYGLDAGAPSATERDAGAARVALFVVDPTQDVPGVRAVAGETTSVLERRGWRVERLDGEAATHAAVRAALERPDVALFHYAGHAVFEGLDGAQAGLRLGGDARFTVADVLALGRVPREVVLLACEGGRTESGAAGLGIAQAFLLRGADAAVAAPRAVEDAMASRLGAALAAELGTGKSVLDALSAAQAALFREAPSDGERPDGWSAFRAWAR